MVRKLWRSAGPPSPASIDDRIPRSGATSLVIPRNEEPVPSKHAGGTPSLHEEPPQRSWARASALSCLGDLSPQRMPRYRCHPERSEGSPRRGECRRKTRPQCACQDSCNAPKRPCTAISIAVKATRAHIARRCKSIASRKCPIPDGRVASTATPKSRNRSRSTFARRRCQPHSNRPPPRHRPLPMSPTNR